MAHGDKDIVDRGVERYLYDAIPPRDAVAAEMEALGRKLRFPIVGPLVGRFLAQQARMVGARRVFELGSGFGYSAYWFLSGMPADGFVTLTDGSAENGERARDFLSRAGFAGRFRIETGDALSALRRTDGPFDVVYNDIDKHEYPDVVEPALARLRVGGLLISDNLLWGGSVADPSDDSPDTRGIREFTRRLYAREGELWTTVVPLRDGVSVSMKLR